MLTYLKKVEKENDGKRDFECLIRNHLENHWKNLALTVGKMGSIEEYREHIKSLKNTS